MANKRGRASALETAQDAVIVSAEQLRQRRPISVYRMAKFSGARGEYLCLVRSISSRSLTAQTRASVVVGERIMFDFGNEAKECTVGSVDGGCIGVTFDEPVDVQAWLDSGDGQHRRAAPRISIAARARLQIGNQILFVTARNISQDGIGIETDDILVEGDALKVALRGWHGAIAGTITRVEGDFAAIRFLQPLGFEALSEWLAGAAALRQTPLGEGGYDLARS
ncbi:PilZ domain-containing protein [Sphingomonas parva]|nr:PilZ domain-containing protein [Sphingomonas parva]